MTTGPVNTATTLAFERTRLAYERTMMAWVRTGTSLITFGFSVYKFFQFELKKGEVDPMVIGPRGFGIALIAIGLFALVLGAFEYKRDLKQLRHAIRRDAPFDEQPRGARGGRARALRAASP